MYRAASLSNRLRFEGHVFKGPDRLGALIKNSEPRGLSLSSASTEFFRLFQTFQHMTSDFSYEKTRSFLQMSGYGEENNHI